MPEESEQSKEEEHGDLSEYTVRRKGMVMRVRKTRVMSDNVVCELRQCVCELVRFILVDFESLFCTFYKRKKKTFIHAPILSSSLAD